MFWVKNIEMVLYEKRGKVRWIQTGLFFFFICRKILCDVTCRVTNVIDWFLKTIKKITKNEFTIS